MPLDAGLRLPVAVQGADDESGMSHVMRAFWANGVSLERGFAWLGVRALSSLGESDARRLSWATQKTGDWLRDRLFLRSGRGAESWLRLGSHRFSRSMVLSARTAPLCVGCVKARGYGDLTWAFKFAPGCSRHGVLLSRACGHCGRRIEWDRPRIDICRCGRYFSTDARSAQLDPWLVSWHRWIEQRLGFGQAAQDDDRYIVPAMLDRLSLDGAFHVVEAFGLLSEPAQALRLASSRARSAEGRLGVIGRGLERLSALDLDPAVGRDLAPLVHAAALERLRVRAAEPVDAQGASRLLRWISGRDDGTVDLRCHGARGQLNLFE